MAGAGLEQLEMELRLSAGTQVPSGPVQLRSMALIGVSISGRTPARQRF
jgi:hypothetical protein